MNTHIHKSTLLQREIQEARFGPQTPISIFPQNLEILENHENPKSQLAPKMDSRMLAIFKMIRLGKSMPMELTRTSGMKNIIYSFRNSVFFNMDPDKFHLRSADIPRAFRRCGRDSECWRPGMLRKCSPHTFRVFGIHPGIQREHCQEPQIRAPQSTRRSLRMT